MPLPEMISVSLTERLQMCLRLDAKWNKAVYTAASVAYRWARAEMQVKLPFVVFLHCVIDRLTDGATE